MLKGFKDFLMRGNVIDLAVAVVIGTAFTAIVTSVTEHLIQPLIAAIGGANVSGLAWTIVDGNPKSTVDFAAVITAIINFLIVAAVVYFMLVYPLKKIQERRKRGEEEGPSEPSEVELLIEIRDLLQQQREQGQPQGFQPQGFQPQTPPPAQPTGPVYPHQPAPGQYPPQQPPGPGTQRPGSPGY
ncbi:large-conductance mechanosensitive channel [Actinophytocola xanthii]|uniref:Large-conductance mechanosensitive channel n=1 Tax=Actinophytocola xanthii TaxID=1912961 RepID=A0A1Q8CLK6_9PSEU|nr:large-conductance mechanosensitive channel [Actinophytocola xanthii]